jgi:hypothetical protein
MLDRGTHTGAAHRLQLSRGRDEVRGTLELLLGRCEDSCFWCVWRVADSGAKWGGRAGV